MQWDNLFPIVSSILINNLHGLHQTQDTLLIVCMNTLRRKHKTHPTDYIEDKIKVLEVSVQKKISHSKAEYESSLVNQCAISNSRIFKYIKGITKYKSIPSVVYFNSNMAKSDIEKSNLFNHYFHSVFTDALSTWDQILMICRKFQTP